MKKIHPLHHLVCTGIFLAAAVAFTVPGRATTPATIVAEQDVREGYITVTGGKVWFRIVGVNRPGIPLLALHGGPGATSDSFVEIEALADERPLVVYDQLGSGKSDTPAGNALYTTERYVEELGQVRAALGLKRVHLLGHSWGSMLATDYLLTKPAGVESVILSGPCLSAKRWVADQQAYLEQMPDRTREKVARHEAAGTTDSAEYQAIMKAYYREHLLRLDQAPPGISGRFGEAVYNYMWGASEFTCTGTLQTYDRVERLRELHLPVIFMCGEFDEATPAATAYYQGKLPGAKLRVFTGASHMTYVEQPAEFCAAVRAFLHEVEGR